jgi:hypothetical protein
MISNSSRGAAENESALAFAVNEDSQDRKKIRPPLNLVDDDDACQRSERRQRLREARQASRILEIEIPDGARGDESPGQRRLAALSRANQGHDAAPLQRTTDLGEQGGAIDHSPIVS